MKNLPIRQVITSFAGLRAHEDGHEFILGEVEDAPHFIDCAGIESPGLTSAPAIGEYIGNMMRDMMGLEEKDNWISTRKDVLDPKTLSKEEYVARLKKSQPMDRSFAVVNRLQKVKFWMQFTDLWVLVLWMVLSVELVLAWEDARLVSAVLRLWIFWLVSLDFLWKRLQSLVVRARL